MSEADRLRLSYAVESTYGTFPTTQFKPLRFTSESIKQATETVQSQEIRGDRQRGKVARTKINAAGGLNYHLSYSTYDDFIKWALFSSGWSTAAAITGTDISAAASDNSINSTSTDLTTNISQYDWIKVSGFTGTTANNGYMKVTSVATNKLIVTGKTLVDDAAGESVTIEHDGNAKNETTLYSFSAEKKFQDLTDKYARITGLVVDSWSMDVEADQIVSGAFEFLGAKEVSSGSAAAGGYGSATTTEIINSVDEVKSVLEAQATFAGTRASFSMSNNLRERIEIGNLGATEIKAGTVSIEGTLHQYLKSEALMDKYLNFTATSLAIVVEDTAGNGYVIDFPRVRFTDGQRLAGGIDSDIIAEMTWSAERDSTENVMVRVMKVSA